MIARNKAGTFHLSSSAGLVDFLRGELGMRECGGGVVGVKDGLDVALVASVPFCLSQAGEHPGVSETPCGISWTFSTFDLDRFDERIDPAGWDFKRYLENPVIQWAHRYDIPAIGRADGLCTDDKGLHGSIVFNDRDYDTFGWSIGQRVRAGVIRAGSVGFRVLEVELPDKEAGKDGTTLIFRKQELLEFSICNVPANPYALMKAAGPEGSGDPPDFWGGFIQS
jgi:HK97 family phage prohead protease